MSILRLVIVAAALALAACETVPAAAPAPAGPAAIPNTPLSLGDYRNANEAATLTQFQEVVAGRYGVGLPLSDVTGDLRQAQFTCAAPPARGDGRGDPPAQACRRTVTVASCRHTWQVLLYDANNDARIARTRALYDRNCGGDGLLGG